MDMVKRRVRSKSKGIQLRRRSVRSSSVRHSMGVSGVIDGFLDRSVSVRSLVKYSGITVAFILIFAFVFFLGRLSVDAEVQEDFVSDNVELSDGDQDVMSSGPGDEDDTDVSGADENNETEDDEVGEMNLSDSDDAAGEEGASEGGEREGDVVVEGEDEDDADGADDEEPECTPRHAEFDYTYRLVDIDVSNFNKDIRGDNWATIESLKLTITNNERCTIINPTQIKIKINNRGKGSVWWDDEVFLPKTFLSMKPGETVSEIVPVHVSYADIYSEKDFRLTVFDDYGIEIGTFKDYITFS